jgi:hypothetical protein
MKQRIAILCCAMVIQSSIVSAGDTGSTAPQPNATRLASNMGPLRRASLTKTTWAPRSDRASNTRQAPAPGAAPAPDTRSWVERHPAWTGAMVGFAAGSVITYAATASSNKDQLLDFSGLRGAAVLLFGGVSAGIGALAGWGIGRSQDDGYHDRAPTVAPEKSR